MVLKKIYSALNGDMTKIKFYSDINDFKVILYNENYGRKSEIIYKKNRENYTENYTEKLNKTKLKIIKLIAEKPDITQEILAKKLGLSRAAIALNLKQLKESQIIERFGSDRKRIWKIVKTSK